MDSTIQSLADAKHLDSVRNDESEVDEQQTEIYDLLSLLPIELLYKILEYCDLNTLFTCRLVCKLWRSVVGDIKLDQLVLSNSHFSVGELERWAHTNRPINRSIHNLINCRSLYLLESSILNLRHLKYLLLDNFDLKDDEYKILNKCPHLEYLSFEDLYFSGPIQLCFDQLKILEFGSALNIGSTFDDRLTIDCPKLTELMCASLSGIEIKHPETLRSISIAHFDDQIFNFRNLESIAFEKTGQQEHILQQLPHLRSISIGIHGGLQGRYSDHIFFGARFLANSQFLRNLINEKQNLKRDVKLSIMGIEIKSRYQLMDAFWNYIN